MRGVGTGSKEILHGFQAVVANRHEQGGLPFRVYRVAGNFAECRYP